MPLKTYRYAVCGGSNLVFDTCLFIFTNEIILEKKQLDLGFEVFESYIASIFIVFPITFFSGFLLNKYIAFQDSSLKGKAQIQRYFLVIFGAIILNYILMKLFAGHFGLDATLSKILTIGISVIYSYLLQSRFSFK
jgi:putative flippase GtrA